MWKLKVGPKGLATVEVDAFLHKGDPDTRTKAERWGPGPWDDEPDQVEWMAHGHPCVLVRNLWGVWCGYVGVEPGHPWHGVSLREGVEADVHGGVSFADRWHHPLNTVATNPESWWVGFDCGHAFDVQPGLRIPGTYMAERIDRGLEDPDFDWQYRDVAYAVKEATMLALQASLATHLLPAPEGHAESDD